MGRGPSEHFAARNVAITGQLLPGSAMGPGPEFHDRTFLAAGPIRKRADACPAAGVRAGPGSGVLGPVRTAGPGWGRLGWSQPQDGRAIAWRKSVIVPGHGPGPAGGGRVAAWPGTRPRSGQGCRAMPVRTRAAGTGWRWPGPAQETPPARPGMKHPQAERHSAFRYGHLMMAIVAGLCTRPLWCNSVTQPICWLAPSAASNACGNIFSWVGPVRARRGQVHGR
jgi:hypothetical protein